jgi:hypothetical protein
MPLQPCPAGKPGLARYGELGIAQLEWSLKDFFVRRPRKSRMKFPYPLRRPCIPRRALFQ